MNIQKSIMRRSLVIYLFVVVLCVGVLLKVIYIQAVDGEDLRSRAKKISYRYVEVEAMRGNVLANDGTLLATTVPVFDVYMDVASPNISDWRFNNKYDSLSYRLSRLFKDRSKWEYKSLLKKARKAKKRYQLIKRDVDYSELKKLRTFPIFRRGKYKGGLIAERRYEPRYPYDLLAKRTIGYESVINEDTLYIGLEGGFSEYLSGESGKVLKKRITGNIWVPVDFGANVEPRHGNDIKTTIDVAIQDVAEDALKRKLQKEDGDAGCAVLMEVSTGNIVAIANLKKGRDGKYREVFNYAIAETIEPGSVFKLPSLMVALEDGYVDLEDSVDVGNGEIVFHGKKIVDSHAPEDGFLTIKEVFETSSNVGTTKTIYDIYSEKPDKFIEGLYDMSLNQALDIPIFGERKPFIKDPKDKSWSKVSLPFMSMGYELTITPLQMLTFYNAVANDGVMVKPRFVTDIQRNNEVLESFETEVINPQICSSSTIEKAQAMMLGVSVSGTASGAFKGASYSVAGKTGTAQIVTNGKYDKKNYTATFAGYFPADKPKYSCIVVVIRPNSGRYYASSVAAPVFREIADKVYATNIELNRSTQSERDTIMNFVPAVWSGNRSDLAQIYNQIQIPIEEIDSLGDWVVCKKADGCVSMKRRNISKSLVPDVRGMSGKDAVYLLELSGYLVSTKGVGFVKQQSVKGGTRITSPGKVVLTLAKK